LVIDTGATYTVISSKLARSLGLQTTQVSTVSWGKRVQVRAGLLRSVGIGDQVLENVETRIADLSIASGLRVDLLVGLDLLKRISITIDYVNRTLTLGDEVDLPNQADFYAKLPFVLMRIAIQGKRLALVLDTGSPYLVFFQDEVEGRINMVRTRDRQRIAHAAGKVTLRKIVLEETQLGERDLGAVSAYLMAASSAPYGGADGILSPTALGLARLHLDFESGQIGWEF
jgi:predicted aspartyl protease